MAILLGVPVQRLKHETTSSEFVMWCVKMDADHNAFHRGDHYLAQIAAEIRRGNLKPADAKKLCHTDFLLKFTDKKPPAKPSQAMLDAQKAMWFGRVGYKPDGK